MYKVDEILDMLDWNNTEEIQKKGLELSKNVKCLKVFFQPYGKNVWGNCALALVCRTDEELQPYLTDMFVWLEDINWPGAIDIAKRLTMFENQKLIMNYKKEYIKIAKALNNEQWLLSLNTYENYCD